MRALVVAAVVLASAPALAGCFGGDGDGPSILDPSPRLPTGPTTAVAHGLDGSARELRRVVDDAASLPVGHALYPGFTTFEPTIGATSDGAVFVTNFGGTGRGTFIVKSADQGATWTNVGPFAPDGSSAQVPTSNDPYLYVDPWTDRIVKFDMHALTGMTFEYSDDGGATWSLVTVAAGAPPAAQDHQSLASAPVEGVATQGYPNVFVYCVNRGPNVGGAWCSTSTDGGLTWTPLVPGFPPTSPQCIGLHGHVAGSVDGAFYRGQPSCNGPAVYRSLDGGASWTQHELPGDTGIQTHEVSTAADDDGNVYAFWMGSDGLPYLATSTDQGETWAGPFMVAAPGVTATDFPAVYAGAPGHVTFAYIGSTLAGGYDAPAEDHRWNTYIGVVHDALDPAGTVLTVAANDPADPTFKGACGRTRCGGFGDFIDVTIDPDGRPWAAFADMCDEACAGGGGNSGGNQMMVGTLVTGRSLRTGAALPGLTGQP